MYNILYLFLIFITLFIYISFLTVSYIPINIIGYFQKNSKKKSIKLAKNPIKFLTKCLLKPYPLLKLSFFKYNSYKLSYIGTYIYDSSYPSLIFIHGSYSSSIIWIETINKILKLNPKLNIYAIDLLGAGLSSDANTYISYLNFLDINILLLHEFIKEKKLIDPILISSSFGGLFNLEYNIKYPTRSIIFNPPAIFSLINKYQYYITLLGKFSIINHSLSLFSPEILYKIGINFGLHLETIYWLITLRHNKCTNNILKGIKLNLLNAYCVRSIIKFIVNRNDIKSKIKIIFSLKDDIVGKYAGELLEPYGFDISYIDHSHFIGSYDKIGELILNYINTPVNWVDKGTISFTNNNKYFFYPSPSLSQDQINLLISDIKCKI